MPELNLQQIAQLADDVEALHQSATNKNVLKWQSASRTDIGRVRPLNEDAFLDSPEQRLWAVADGIGGHSRGDYASSTVVKQLREFPRQGSLLANLQDIEDRLQEANERCRHAFRTKRPGTTVATLLAHGNYCFYLWAGDSRVYRLREENLEQLTLDHSVAQQKLANGEMTEEEAETHQSSHVLTRAVGIRDRVELDLGFSEVLPGDRFLLCSDGLYNPVKQEDIRTTLSDCELNQACHGLVDLALEQGGPDNITVIVAEAGTK